MMEEINDRDEEIQSLKEKYNLSSNGNSNHDRGLENENHQLKKELALLKAETLTIQSKSIVET